MTTVRQLRRAALGLGQAEEITDEQGRPAFAVGGRMFAVLRADQMVFLPLPEPDRAAVCEACPAALPTVEDGLTGVRLPLSAINGQQLNHWVRRAWAGRAPRDLADRSTAAAVSEPGAVGDLPRSIGRPATRALADLGVNRLEQVAAMSDDELLAVHGVGPKAVRLLREAIGPS